MLALALALCALVARADEPGGQRTFDLSLLAPFWRSEIMRGESVLFMKDRADTEPGASLMFAPTKVVAVQSSSGKIAYAEGRDYRWNPNRREITLPPGSRIPFRRPEDLRRPVGSQPFRLMRRDGGGEILFGAGHEYHDMQAVITYEHKPGAWAGPVPSFAGDRLPRTLGKLKEKAPLRVALLGDSISTGCNASGWAGVAPFQPPYQDLWVRNLRAVYGGQVSLANFAVGGTGSAWGLASIGRVMEAKPDLVLLAFGMNDSAGVPVDQYQANLRGMIDAVHKAQPRAEIILVATMLGNKDWVALHQDLFPRYRDALARLCRPGVALADLTSIWAELLKYKRDQDMTGNGVNHPNDFGHRVYAQVLSALLIDSP
jgi:lysophospholipase L1-like esterase